MPQTLHIQPSLIQWAITRAGYEVDAFIERFPKVQLWIEEGKQPTLSQLRDFAQKTHVPFGYLLLEAPPEETLPIPFFRSTQHKSQVIPINLKETITTIHRRQQWLTQYLQEQGYTALPFVGKFTADSPMEVVVRDIRSTLSLQEHWASECKNWQEALQLLTERAEDAGIYVFFNGVVGNNTHRPIEVKDCRGFVLSDSFAPCLFVNADDSKAAQMFTIVHELAHIWVGKSAGFDFRKLLPHHNLTELFCDSVAAEFLVPEQSFRSAWQQNQDFDTLARQFKVSQLVIARRALDGKYISRKQFFDFYDEHIAKYVQINKNKVDGGNFYATLRRRLNPRYFKAVNTALNEGRILHKTAYQLTDLKGKTYHSAVEKLL
ncbi:MAG: ImmA/IrrE family metallo-endopeptidase [Balneolales bacterium]|nr:ImmA/IrrE family metallo-endopeptidase [Balneolales bacterium]